MTTDVFFGKQIIFVFLIVSAGPKYSKSWKCLIN